MNLCLGTVQFGMPYGLNGKLPPSMADSIAMLNYAVDNGIAAIDTAQAYGNAEDVVGAFLRQTSVKREDLFISSKMMPNVLDDIPPDHYEDEISKSCQGSLKRLHTDYLDAFLFHSARFVFNDEMLSALAKIKDKGFAKKVGVSVYEPNEALAGVTSPHVDFLQMPYSVFDQRMSRAEVFAQALGNTEIHTRSAFLQGLLMMSPEVVPPFLQKAKRMLLKFNDICRQYSISKLKAIIDFVKNQDGISHMVFGVHDSQQLRNNISTFADDKPLAGDIYRSLRDEFCRIEDSIIIPSLWRKP